MTTERNRQLLYAAVYKNTNLRKFKQEKKSQVLLNHQRQQQFQFDQGVSTIHRKSDCSGRDSRIDFQNLFEKRYDPVKQKQYLNSNSKSKFQPFQLITEQRSKTQFSLQNSANDMSNNKKNQRRKNSQGPGYIINKYIKMKKPSRTSQHIFVIRNTDKRYSQSEEKNKVKYLQIPVQCKNIKIIQMNNLINNRKRSLKQQIRSTSLNQIKRNNNIKIQDCPNDHGKLGQKCKYCKMTQKNNQMMKKYFQSTSLLQKISFH